MEGTFQNPGGRTRRYILDTGLITHYERLKPYVARVTEMEMDTEHEELVRPRKHVDFHRLENPEAFELFAILGSNTKEGSERLEPVTRIGLVLAALKHEDDCDSKKKLSKWLIESSAHLLYDSSSYGKGIDDVGQYELVSGRLGL